MCSILPQYENTVSGNFARGWDYSEERNDVDCSPKEDEEWTWEGKSGVMNTLRDVSGVSRDICKLSSYQEWPFRETIWKLGL